MKLSRSLLLVGASGLLVMFSGCGTGTIRDGQMKRLTVEESQKPGDVLEAASSVLKERYYQVKVYKSSKHIVALTPIQLVGNNQVRKKIDVWVFLENGYYMPKVWVRQFIDSAEPPVQSGLLAGHFPPEIMGSVPPAVTENWQPLIYDRHEGQQIYLAILERLKVPSTAM